MEETMKRLIDAEIKAEAMIKQADNESEHIVHQAVREARLAEEQYEVKIPELYRSLLQAAEKRAEQRIAELQHCHREQIKALQISAREREQQAIDAACALLLDLA